MPYRSDFITLEGLWQDFLRWIYPPNPMLAELKTGKLIVGRPAQLKIQTRRTASAVLIVSDKNGEIYRGPAPLCGSVPITPTDTAPMRMLLTLSPLRHHGEVVSIQRVLEAKAIPPRKPKISAPRHARAGDAITISWRAADEVTVDVEGCGLLERHAGKGEYAFVLRPQQGGAILLTFTVTDRFNSITKTRVIKVGKSPPRIVLNKNIASAKPGERVMFSWTITMAGEAWIEMRGERHPVKLEDAIETGIGLEREDLRLIAKGPDGTTLAKLSVIPDLWSGLNQ